MRDKLFKKYRYSFILLRELVITDFKLRYQNSALGYLWALLRPLFLFVILYVFFVHILHIGRNIEHWGVALLLGVVLWTFFSEVVKQGLKSVVSSGGIIRKINFPKYVIVLATSLSALINLTINLVIVAIFAFFDGVELSWGVLILLPLIVQLYVFALGLAFLLAAINVRFRDIGYMWDVISQALFYGSAIMFPINRVVEVSQDVAMLLLMNPLTQVVQDARYFAVTQQVDTIHTLTSSALIISIPFIVTAGFFAIGAAYFRYRSPHFSEEI